MIKINFFFGVGEIFLLNYIEMKDYRHDGSNHFFFGMGRCLNEEIKSYRIEKLDEFVSYKVRIML